MRSVTTNPTYYKEIFRVLCEKCQKAKLDKAWAEGVFPSAVVDKLRQTSENEAFKSLGIGSGTGEFECSLLNQLSKRFPRIEHTVVEPAKDFVDHYKTLVSSKRFDLKDVTYTWRVQTMQEFQKTAGENEKFHFISSVHSIYYADDLTGAIRFFVDSLIEGGILMISVTTDDSSNTKFILRFPTILDNNPHISLVNAAHVRASLDTLGLPFSVHRQTSAADIAAIFDESSTEGNQLLDMLTHTIDFRRAAPGSLVAEVLAYLNSDECCQILDGEVLFKNPWETFLIHRSA